MTRHTFRDLMLAEAEESLVACCLDSEHCLLEAVRELGLAPFRSEKGASLEPIYAYLVEAYLEGSYDPQESRYWLQGMLSDQGERWYVTDDLYDGNAASREYCSALVAALRDTYEAQDRATRAALALRDTPVRTYQPSASPPVMKRQGPRLREGRHSGGILL